MGGIHLSQVLRKSQGSSQMLKYFYNVNNDDDDDDDDEFKSSQVYLKIIKVLQIIDSYICKNG